MKRSEEVWFVANDGARFQSEAAALQRDAQIVEVDAIMAPLGASPVDAGGRFVHGEGYIQHDPATVRSVRRALGVLTLKTYSWIDVRGTPLEAVDSLWWIRMLDSEDSPIERAWHRFYCFDETSREWGQPYFALNPTKGKQVEWSRG